MLLEGGRCRSLRGVDEVVRDYLRVDETGTGEVEIVDGRLQGAGAAMDLPDIAIFEYIGTMFLNALKMIIVPLIMSSIIVGVAGIGSGGNLGSLGGKTLLYYMTTSLFAILAGLLLVNLIAPGIVDGEPARDILPSAGDDGAIAARVEGHGALHVERTRLEHRGLRDRPARQGRHHQ